MSRTVTIDVLSPLIAKAIYFLVTAPRLKLDAPVRVKERGKLTDTGAIADRAWHPLSDSNCFCSGIICYDGRK